MNKEKIEQLYIIGDYSKLLKEIHKVRYNDPSTVFSDIEKAIYISYHSRALIRLGKVNEAELIINLISKTYSNKKFSISSLINQTSIINLQITQGNIDEALLRGMHVKTLVEQKEQKLNKSSTLLSSWSAFLYFLIGMAYNYQFKYDLGEKLLQKSLHVNETNLFIKAKCLYYLAFWKLNDPLEKDITLELLGKSLGIFKAIDAKQGPAWIMTWQGQIFLRSGDFEAAKRKFLKAIEIFESINDVSGSNIANTLIGLMFYQKGRLKQAEEIIKQAFDSLIQVGNPLMLSYCLLPLVLLYIESGNRLKAQNYFKNFQEISKTSNSRVVKLNRAIAEAIILKSSSRFVDKAQAQKKLLGLLKKAYKENQNPIFSIIPTADKDFSFFIIFHLIELYLEEFKLTEDNNIMLEVQQLINTHVQNVDDQKFSPKLGELLLLKAKLLTIEGKIKDALTLLDQIKQEANAFKFFRLEKLVRFEIFQIEKEIQKWDAVQKSTSLKNRLEMAQLDDYIKEIQKIVQLQ